MVEIAEETGLTPVTLTKSQHEAIEVLVSVDVEKKSATVPVPSTAVDILSAFAGVLGSAIDSKPTPGVADKLPLNL